MSDNLPNQNDPPNNLGVVTPPQDPVPEVPSTPNSPPSPPNNNNTVDPVQSWVAKHEARDASGRFIPTEHLKNPSPNSPNTPNNPNLPLPIQVTQNNKYSEKNDPPMVDLKVTNPVTYFKKWVGKFLKNQDIDIHLKIKPFATIGLILAFTAVGGTTFSIGRYFFPNSSPIFHRAITLQGIVQMSESGQYYLSLPDNTLWTLKPINNNVNLSNYIYKQVVVKGNLTAEANVINVSEVIAFDKPTAVIYAPTPQSATESAQKDQ